VPQRPQDEGGLVAPKRSAKADGDHDVTAASRPVKAFVPVQIRLVTPIYGSGGIGAFGRPAKVPLNAMWMITAYPADMFST